MTHNDETVYTDAPSPSAHPPINANEQFIEYADSPPQYTERGEDEFIEYADDVSNNDLPYDPPSTPHHSTTHPTTTTHLHPNTTPPPATTAETSTPPPPLTTNTNLKPNSNASDLSSRTNSDHSDSMKSLERVSSRRSAYRSSNLFNAEEETNLNNPNETEEGPLGRAREGEQVDLRFANQPPTKQLIETLIEWNEGGNSVYVTGSFTGWKQMIPLRKMDDSSFMVVLKLAPGTHRLRFVVDGELRCSNSMNSATDSMGNLVNYIEVYDEGSPEVSDFEDSLEADYSYSHEYTQEIPEIFADPEAFDQYSSIEFAPPPQLPPHLDGVILNTNNTEKDNNSVLPIPNHVVLNHLATTSIKHNVLAVASVSRYHAKYVTQILYTPIEGI